MNRSSNTSARRRLPAWCVPGTHQAWIAVATVWLSGCATPPAQPPLQSETVQSWTRELEQMQIEPLTGPLSLDMAMARALKYNLERRARQLEQDLASGQLEAALQELLPKASVQVDSSRRSQSRQTWNIDRSAPSGINSDLSHVTQEFTLSWSLLDFGLGYLNARQSRERVSIASERRRKLIHTLVQDVRSAYWRAACAQAMREQLRKTLAEAELALADARQIEGERVKGPHEWLVYQKQLLESVRILEQIEQELAPAFVELATLINAPRGQPLELAPQWPQLNGTLQVPTEALEALALERNADLREAQHQTRIAQDEPRKVLARLYPNLSFRTGLRYDSDSYLVHQNWNEAGLQISLNLIGLLTAPTQIRLAEMGIALADQRRLVTQMAVITQVHLGRLNWLSAQRQAQRAEQIWSVEDRLASVAQAREKALMRGRLETVQAQASALLSQFRRYQSVAQVQVAESRLRAVLGIEFDEAGVDRLPLEEIAGKVRQTPAITALSPTIRAAPDASN